MSKDKDTLPRWDMTNVYPSLVSAEFEEANQKFSKMIQQIGDYIEELNINPNQPPKEKDPAVLASTVGGFIDLANETLQLGGTIRAFIFAFVSTDSFDTDAAKAMSEFEQSNIPLNDHINVTFKSWVGQIADVVPEIVEQPGTSKEHAFFLQETAEQSKFMMSPAEENLASELYLSGAGAWGKLQGTITSQLKWEIENEEGVEEAWPMAAIINLRSHPNVEMRRKGYDAEIAAWGSVEHQLAACLNGVKGAVSILDRRRGREDAVHDSIDSARIDRQTLDAMMGAMKDSFPMFRKYFKTKAKRMGNESLPWWDVFAPTGATDRVFTYEEACDFVVDNFRNFSDGLADYARKAIDQKWIDVGPREGKRAGAFCMAVPGVDESRILLNFDGSLDAVSTLAHELGHGFHNQCTIGKKELQTITPMTLAETASIMCQTIITQASLKAAQSPEEELAILENDLVDASQVVVDIYSRYMFESEVFERRAKSELSSADLNEIMENAQKTTYGDGLDPEYLQRYMWTWKSHYYSGGRSFYNYPYAFGLLFATGLYAVYQERGDEFIEQYSDLLASTGEGSAADLAMRIDIDNRSKDFWTNSLKVVEAKVDRYQEL
ncbi:MAG: M3 family oligoendopeptidase [Chloroflexota bacterium]